LFSCKTCLAIPISSCFSELEPILPETKAHLSHRFPMPFGDSSLQLSASARRRLNSWTRSLNVGSSISSKSLHIHSTTSFSISNSSSASRSDSALQAYNIYTHCETEETSIFDRAYAIARAFMTYCRCRERFDNERAFSIHWLLDCVG